MAFAFGFDQIGVPPPKLWQMASRSMKFFCASTIALINGTSWIADHQQKVWSLILGITIVGCQAFDMFLGEVSAESATKSTTTQLNS